jgi:hypothetical protein
MARMSPVVTDSSEFGKAANDASNWFKRSREFSALRHRGLFNRQARDLGRVHDKIPNPVSLTPGFRRVSEVVQLTTSGFNRFSGAH